MDHAERAREIEIRAMVDNLDPASALCQRERFLLKLLDAERDTAAAKDAWKPGDPRCDRCDNGIRSDWCYCPFCGYPQAEYMSEAVAAAPREMREKLCDAEVWFQWLCLTYVQHADARQRNMGLQYTTAETRNLASEIVKAIRAALPLPGDST